MNIIQIIGYKNTGKTTLACKLIEGFSSRGMLVGSIKHDSHDFEIDHPGRDTWKHREAGAHVVAITSPSKTAMIEQQYIPLDQLIARMQHTDAIIVEGFKLEGYPKLVMIKEESDKELLDIVSNVIGVVSWLPWRHQTLPTFHVDDLSSITEFLLSSLDHR